MHILCSTYMHAFTCTFPTGSNALNVGQLKRYLIHTYSSKLSKVFDQKKNVKFTMTFKGVFLQSDVINQTNMMCFCM